MAEIIDESQSKPIQYITDEMYEGAANAKQAADEFFEATNPFDSVEIVKTLRNAINAALPSVYPVEVGAPTEPYIESLLKERKALEQAEQSVRSGKIPVQPEDEEAAAVAFNLFQRFSMAFMSNLFYFEPQLTPEQRW